MPRRSLYVLFILTLIMAFSQFQRPQAVRAEGTNSTTEINQVLVDSPGGRIFVLWSRTVQDQTIKTLSMVQTDSGEILGTYVVPSPTVQVAVHPGTDNAYAVTKWAVYHLDLGTGELTKTVDIPEKLWDVKYVLLNPTSGKLYVSSLGVGRYGDYITGTLIIDEATGSVSATMPYLVRAIDPVSNRVFALETRLVGKDPYNPWTFLVTLEGATEARLGEVRLIKVDFVSPFSFAVNTPEKKLYVSYATLIWVVDASTTKLISTHQGLFGQIGALNEKENKMYGPSFGSARWTDTTIVDVQGMQVVSNWGLGVLADLKYGYWSVVGADSARNLLVLCNYQSAANGVVLLIADGHNDTVQRRVVISLALTVPPAAQPIEPSATSRDHVYFQQTGHSIAHGFKSYWESNGGLPVLGYPITEEMEETDPVTYVHRTVQYFERARLEYHSELAGTPYEVELGLLGSAFAARWAPAFDTGTNDQHAYFPETGQYLSYGFKYYWEHNGGLAIFGLPITGEFSEVNPIDGKTYTVQYFERARFEYHPEFAGTPYETELGLLGNQALQARGWIK